nr:ERCC4 domain-containing protein [Spirochaetales bacterium]
MDNLTITIDSREQAPYSFSRWPVTIHRAGLSTGDYSLPGFDDKAAIERKSLDDLVGCLMGKNRHRFERELMRGRVLDLFVVAVEADLTDLARGRYRSLMKPQAALQSITAFYIRYGVPFLFCGSRAGGEYMTYSLLSKYDYEIQKRYSIICKHTLNQNGGHY